MSRWEIYLITRLDSLHDVFAASAFLIGLCIVGGGTVLVATWHDDDFNPHRAKLVAWLKVFLIVFPLLVGLNTLIPSTKEAIAIAALPAAIEDTNDLAPELKKFLHGFLREEKAKFGK